MTIRLTAATETMIQEKLASGEYATPEQVIAQALQALDERDRFHRLRASLEEAKREIDRGEGREWTPELMDILWAEADERYRQGMLPDPDVCP